MEKKEIIEKSIFSEWAAPIVTVSKKDSKIQLCDDYKVMINPVMEDEKYPLLKLDTIFFSMLSIGDKFTKMDLLMTYQLMLLDITSNCLKSSLNTDV